MMLSVHAEPVELGSVKLRDGRELTAVRVMSVGADGLRVEHHDGAGKLRCEVLPSSLVHQFQLTETAAAEGRQNELAPPEPKPAASRPENAKTPAPHSREVQESEANAQWLAIFRQNNDTPADCIF